MNALANVMALRIPRALVTVFLTVALRSEHSAVAAWAPAVSVFAARALVAVQTRRWVIKESCP
jgi:hypothetical protein